MAELMWPSAIFRQHVALAGCQAAEWVGVGGAGEQLANHAGVEGDPTGADPIQRLQELLDAITRSFSR